LAVESEVLEVELEAESAAELAAESEVDTATLDTVLEVTLEALEALDLASILETQDPNPMEVRDQQLSTDPQERADHTKPMIFLPSPILFCCI